MNYAVNYSTINLLMNSNVGQAVLTSVRVSPEPLTHNDARMVGLRLECGIDNRSGAVQRKFTISMIPDG